jgi:pyruvate,water dikinase
VELLQNKDLESLQRNHELQRLAQKLRPQILAADSDWNRVSGDASTAIERFLEHYPEFGCQARQCVHQKDILWNLLKEMAQTDAMRIESSTARRQNLLKTYLASFPAEERAYAENLLSLAQKSYRLRDDDNIYLGRLESLLQEAIRESSQRGEKAEQPKALTTNVEEALRAIQFKPFQTGGWPGAAVAEAGLSLKARQLKGQPASQGIARGKARVIQDTSDLFEIKKGEILVCDAIDPNMTFAVPLAAGIVERRGGMLIHGAIIAREYGIPCVTGIPHATRFIQSGYELTVDGYYGLVIIHAASEGGTK